MEPEDRHAARALLVTPAHEVLLMQFELPVQRIVWITPGGGLDVGEPPRDGVVREVFEETGQRIEPGVPVWKRTHVFELEGNWYRQLETYFLVRTPRFVPTTDTLESVERRWFRAYRWWTIDALKSSEESFAPRELGHHLEALLREGAPPTLLDVGV